ncbi:Uncharacterised protein [Candidatus Bartonella washoeensis]|nr:Uncharacterised protein [Bartonella washoeensis]
MRHKCKLSFSVLMISSCLVQFASAVESKNGALTRMTSVTNGRKVQKGSALITFLVSNNISIEDGGVEVVDNGGTSMGATIETGGKQIVTRQGTAMGTKVNGGRQFF